MSYILSKQDIPFLGSRAIALMAWHTHRAEGLVMEYGTVSGNKKKKIIKYRARKEKMENDLPSAIYCP